jgi:Putative bacterial sensory transduction regulator
MSDATTTPVTAETLLSIVSGEQVAETLRLAGYRASHGEQDGRFLIQSAAQGLGFIVSGGNSAGEVAADRYIDFSFSCLIQVEGDFPDARIAAWNEGKRFGRLFRRGPLLVLSQDVIVAGGVSPRYLLGQCELWDRLLHDFVAFLRQPPADAAPVTGTP